MEVTEYIRYDVQALASLIKQKQVSALDVLDLALARSAEVNPQLNAVITECPDFARHCLSTMSGAEPYYGVPLLVKDLGFALEGVKSTQGSRLFANNIDLVSSDLVNQLISLGFVPFAKTNTPELGLSYVTESALLGPCRNPYDTSRTPGGSSGGSAAAIAAGIAPIATASDGGGSIRIPAACCGLFGFKPTTGLTANGPWTDELWSGMATNFILTRTVRDTKALFSALTEQVAPQNKAAVLDIAIVEGAFMPVHLDAPCLEAMQVATEQLKQLGHRVHKKQLNLDLAAIGQCALTLIAANTYSVIDLQTKALGHAAKEDELEPITWEFYRQGQTMSAAQLIQAKNRLYQLIRPLHAFLAQTDAILTPALGKLPLKIGELSTKAPYNDYLQKNAEFSPYTSLFNQAGLPAMTYPVMHHDQLPVSIQLGAGKGRDYLLLDLAEALQSKFS